MGRRGQGTVGPSRSSTSGQWMATRPLTAKLYLDQVLAKKEILRA